MPETGFQPRPRPERSYAAMMFDTAREARQLTRRQPILWVLLAIAFFYGLYSEGLDRLSTAHIVQELGLPTIVAWQPLVWIGLIRVAHNGLALLATEVARRRVDTTRTVALTRVLATNAALIVLAVAGFALTRSFWVGVALFCLVQILRSVNSPLQDAWLNGRIDDSNVRATMFSVSSQMDAIGQIGGGPLVGLIGRNISVRTALLASALILSPVLPLYRLAYRSGHGQPASLTKTGAATD
jgi:DHA3 family tetracycline resistance protein-like MFS transporter